MLKKRNILQIFGCRLFPEPCRALSDSFAEEMIGEAVRLRTLWPENRSGSRSAETVIGDVARSGMNIALIVSDLVVRKGALSAFETATGHLLKKLTKRQSAIY